MTGRKKTDRTFGGELPYENSAQKKRQTRQDEPIRQKVGITQLIGTGRQ